VIPAEALAARDAGPRTAELAPYEHLDAAERFLHLTRDRDLLALLRRHDVGPLADLRILELGCGEGALLRSLLHYRADARKLEAVDVDIGKVGRARASLPDVRLAVGDIASLPYRDGAFDLVFAFTVLSSVLDERARRRGAAEALRVLRPRGLLLVYDFWVNPLNRRVRPLRAGELRDLFAPRPVEMQRVTLAPPIVRALGGRSRLCGPLERLPFLRTHLLAAVMRES
jgi:SAM-dependent methyltransferase